MFAYLLKTVYQMFRAFNFANMRNICRLLLRVGAEQKVINNQSPPNNAEVEISLYHIKY